MELSIRRLGPGDDTVLALLARDDADFDLAGRGAPLQPLTDEAARAYLADPNVLHWVAEHDRAVVGHLYCHLLRKRGGDGSELLLYEIGVRASHRRHGIGRALVTAMRDWMSARRIRETWVLADNAGAVEFYRACGFTVAAPAPVYMIID